jgi:hypothetical protein
MKWEYRLVFDVDIQPGVSDTNPLNAFLLLEYLKKQATINWELVYVLNNRYFYFKRPLP